MSPDPNAPQDPQAPLLAALARIEQRLDHIEHKLTKLEALEKQAPGLAAMAVDAVDDTLRRMSERGVDVDERARLALRVLERLTEPTLLTHLDSLLSRADLLHQGLALAEQAPGLAAAAVDTFDGIMARVQASGVDVDERASLLLQALERLTSPSALEALRAMLAHTDQLKALLDAGVFAPESVRAVAQMGHALSEAASKRDEGPSPWGLFKASGEPEVRQTLGFALRFARAFGRNLQDARALLPSRKP